MILSIFTFLKSIKPVVWGIILVAFLLIVVFGLIYSAGDKTPGENNKQGAEHGANANAAHDNSKVIEGQISEQQKTLDNVSLDRAAANEKVRQAEVNLNSARNTNSHATTEEIENLARRDKR